MKKKIIAISLLFIGALSITSCGDKDGEQQVSDLAKSIEQEVDEEEGNQEVNKIKDIDLDQPFDYNEDKNKDYLITISTEHGDVQLVLYDETIGHKKNFVKLASLGFYNGTAFHRVINGFMIQGGDPNSRENDETIYGRGNDNYPGYTLPAEFNPKFIHKKGAIAAARTGGPSNPNKESSGAQFYIVDGNKVPSLELIGQKKSQIEEARFNAIKQLLNLPQNKADLTKVVKYQQAGNTSGVDSIVAAYTPEANKMIKGLVTEYTPEQLKIYEEIGGSPFLDMEYTVYGEVVKGLDLIDKLAELPVHNLPGANGKPSLPNKKLLMTVSVELLKKRKITKLTGYEYN